MADDEPPAPGGPGSDVRGGWSRPAAPAGRVARLTDRVLVHTNAAAAPGVLDVLSERSGLVLNHSRAAGAAAIRLRDDGFDQPLLLDPAGYSARAPASVAEPFALPTAVLEPFEGLDIALNQQIASGATVALSPTRYLLPPDVAPLLAAAAALDVLGRDDVILSVPVDYGWLRPPPLALLIDTLARIRVPKALFLGRQFAAATTDAEVTAVRRLVAEGGDVALLRTDLFGLDAIAHGAFASSIGTSTTLRHVVPAGQRPLSRRDPHDQSPTLLFRELMSWFSGGALIRRFAGHSAPRCFCRACQGRRIDTYPGHDDTLDAQRHGVALWGEWLEMLHAQPNLAQRARWWQCCCRAALDHFRIMNYQIQQPAAFTADHPLKGWAELDPPPAPAPRRPS